MGVCPKWVTPQRPDLESFIDTNIQITTLSTKALRDLVWYARQNLGPLPCEAWHRHCRETVAPLSPEQHGERSLQHFLGRIWPTGNPDDAPNLSETGDTWDWEEAKMPRILGQILQRVISARGEARAQKHGMKAGDLTKCWMQYQDAHELGDVLVSMVPAAHALRFLRQIRATSAGRQLVRHYNHRTGKTGFTCHQAPFPVPRERAPWLDQMGEYQYAMGSTDPVLEELLPLDAPHCPPLECRKVTKLSIQRHMRSVDPATGQIRSAQHTMVDYARSLTPELEASWRDFVFLAKHNDSVATSAWASNGVVPWLEYIYQGEVPLTGFPKDHSWDGQRAVLADAVRHILDIGDAALTLSWNDFLDAYDTKLGCRPQSQTTGVLRGFLRLKGVTYASHRLLVDFGPAQMVTNDFPRSTNSTPSTAEAWSDAASQGGHPASEEDPGHDEAWHDEAWASDTEPDQEQRREPPSSDGGRPLEDAGLATDLRGGPLCTGSGRTHLGGDVDGHGGDDADSQPRDDRDQIAPPDHSPVTESPGPENEIRAQVTAAPATPDFRTRTGPAESPWQPTARDHREGRASSSTGQDRTTPYGRDASDKESRQTRDSSWWAGHCWHTGWASRDDEHADRTGDVPWHRERPSQSPTFADSWQQDDDWPPLYPNTQDLNGPPQLYRKPMGQIIWRKGDPRHMRETPNEAIKRLKTDLGCYFVGGWHAYVKYYNRGGPVHNDPHRHEPKFAADFLNRLLEAGNDIRVAMKNMGIHVDWWKVISDGKKGHSKGGKSDGKGAGKRPAIDDEPARAQRQRLA